MNTCIYIAPVKQKSSEAQFDPPNPENPIP